MWLLCVATLTEGRMSLVIKQIVLADSHEVTRLGLRTLMEKEPDFRIVGEAADGLQAVRLAQKLVPDVIVLDLMLPVLNGFEVICKIRKISPGTRFVIFSEHKNADFVIESFRRGAEGYVLKDSTGDHVMKAVREAAAGRRYISLPLCKRPLEAYLKVAQTEALDLYDTLTAREREVLHMAAEGKSSAEIGRLLMISPRTVETHRANMMHKLCLCNEAELVRYAMQKGLLPPL